jgi:23S rRNA (uracil1939-C5)-methyltransferase
MEMIVTDLNQQGQGVGRLDGQVVFVDGAIPGDRVRLLNLEQHRQYAIGQLAGLVEASPDRVAPACPLAARCGGCTLQSMAYPAQLRHKRRQIIEQLVRIGGIESNQAEGLVDPVLGMDDPWQYRCKIQFPVRGTAIQPRIGFFERRSHQVVDGQACPVGHPAGDVVRQVLRTYMVRFGIDPYDEIHHRGQLRHIVIRVGYRTGQVMVTLVCRTGGLPGVDWLVSELSAALAFMEDPGQPGLRYALASLNLNLQPARNNVILGPALEPLAGVDAIEDELLGLTFRISPFSFFQVNPRQTEVLYRLALEMAAPSRDEQLLDLYCGTGTITLALASQTNSIVIGIDSVRAAVDDARANALRNQVENAHFEAALAEEWLPAAVANGTVSAGVAVIDPPRRGCDPALIDSLLQVPLKRLVYVSCNPATLARDIARLSMAYQVRRLQPVDMFPWTDSVECVCLLERIVP